MDPQASSSPNDAESKSIDRVRVELSDPQRPALLRGEDSEEFRYLLMPIRVT